MLGKCAGCGGLQNIVIMSVFERWGLRYFCSMSCKKAFLAEKEKEDEKEEPSVLPEVRVLTARKEGERITVVRGAGGFHGRGTSGASQHQRRISSREAKQKK